MQAGAVFIPPACISDSGKEYAAPVYKIKKPSQGVCGQEFHSRYKKANIPPVVSTKSPANNNLLYISETTLRGGFFVLYQVVRIDLPRFPELLIGNKWEQIAHLTEQGFLSKFSPNL